MEVCNFVQEAMIQTICKKKCKKEKWLSEEALQITEERIQAKGKGKKERYTLWMQSSKKHQGEIRKPSEVINTKK